MSNVRIGIVGIGNMGTGHAKNIDNGKVPGGKLAAVCDVNPARLEWATANLSEDVARFDNAEALFDSGTVDAVIIATPHYDHPPLSIKALNKGLHVLCEKPAGVYTRQVQELNEVAKKSDRIFAVMFNQRTRAVHQKVKDLVASGELGEIKRTCWVITDWFRSQFYYNSGGWRATWEGEGGGVLLNQCPHNLDLWQWICGMPSRVRAFCHFGKYHDIEVEDDVTAYVEYPNGATGLFVATTGEAPGTNQLEIAGDRGKVVLANGKLTFWRTREKVSKFMYETDKGFAKPETWICDIPANGKDEGHVGVMKAWVGAIQKDAPLVAEGTEGINSLELSNAMLMSAWTDAWVDLPVDADRYWELLQERIASSTVKKESGDKVLDVEGTY